MAPSTQHQQTMEPVRNHLLAALPADDLALIRHHLKLVTLARGDTLHTAGEPLSAAYFVESGFVSIVSRLESGDLVEVGLIGREGMVGLPLALAADADPNEAMVQGPGTALRIDAGRLRLEMERSTALRASVLRFTLAFHAQSLKIFRLARVTAGIQGVGVVSCGV